MQKTRANESIINSAMDNGHKIQKINRQLTNQLNNKSKFAAAAAAAYE